MRFSLILLFFVGIFCTCAQARQVADTLQLGEVEVQATRIYLEDRYQPISISRIDSAKTKFLLGGNISEVLRTFAPLQIRTNGPGGLATISQRGYSPSQTQVLWNGFQLNHAMLGSTDLTLIPSFAIQNISVASASGNTSFGEKGGGTVALDVKKPKNEIGISQNTGSFGRSVTETFAGVSFGKWQVGFTAGYENSDNNFTYTIREFSNEEGGFAEVEKKRKNNELKAKTGILSLDWKDGKKHFSSVVWEHDMTNHIPGGITSLTPRAYQEDSFLRWMSRYSATVAGHRLTSKIYLNRQALDYFNPTNDINSLSTSTSVIGDVELRSSLHPDLQLISALQLGHSGIKASDYSGSPNRSQFTAQANPIWHIWDPVHFYGGIRIDYYTDFKEAYSANAGVNVELVNEQLFLKGQVSRNFIAPTFNDLYWPDLGDPDLNPETNIKGEIGLLHQTVADYLQNSFEISVYDGMVNDGIRWLPGADGQSRPENLEKLRLWGFEAKEELQFRAGDFHLSMQAMLLHALAEIRKPRFEGDAAVGKQLRYTPKWQVKANTIMNWKNLASMFSYNFTDERFSTTDHRSPFDPLSSYTEATWSTYYNFLLSDFKITPAFTIHNLFDSKYSVVRDYPMPGRSFQFKLTIQYKFK